MLSSIAGIVVGLVLLTAGAEALVRGASHLARAAGISALVVGLTVVAFGTSAPEMAVSVKAALTGQADLALGNVVGSNIFNVLFILGVSALIAPLVVGVQLVRLDVPVMIAVSLVVQLLALDGSIGRLEGAILFGGIVAYTVLQIVQGRRESRSNPAAEAEFAAEFGEAAGTKPGGGFAWNLALVGGGLALLVGGARLFVFGAVDVARALGVSELVIGLTIVAAGTSLPEVAASIMATLKGERDIAVGNVVGSNIFNILAVLGASALAAPDGIAVSVHAARFDLPVMAIVAAACLPVFFTGHRIARWEGALFLLYYVAYTVHLILAARRSDALPAFSIFVTVFIAPLTVATLGVSLWRHFREDGSGKAEGTGEGGTSAPEA